MRDLCKNCNSTPVAVNYIKDGRHFYRSVCDHCARGYKTRRPLWALAGYKKKLTCDRCGFTSKYSNQFDVYFVDGDLTNCRVTNLKTVCANCQRILRKLNLPWRQGDLTPDF